LLTNHETINWKCINRNDFEKYPTENEVLNLELTKALKLSCTDYQQNTHLQY